MLKKKSCFFPSEKGQVDHQTDRTLWSGGDGETDSQAGIMTLLPAGQRFQHKQAFHFMAYSTCFSGHLASRLIYNVECASQSVLPSFWCLWIGKRAKTGRRTAPVYSNNGYPQSVAAWTHNKSDSVKINMWAMQVIFFSPHQACWKWWDTVN